MKRKLRGSGYKHTLPWVLPTFAIWVVVLVVTAPILSITMMLSGLVPTYLHNEIWFFLLTLTPAIAVAGIGLAILTTARSAGPLVQLGRAFEDVKQGDMDRRLRFRKGDKAYRRIEKSFNGMMVALSERVDGAGPEAEDQAATRPPPDENQQDLALSPEPSLLGEG
jgi:methyl-accepting chemotaxis protein